MFDTVSDRMPRTVRRPLSATALRQIDQFVTGLDRAGANSRSIVRDASNDVKRKLRAA
jgi:hypothetical protein